jgi:hypothetical protein
MTDRNEISPNDNLLEKEFFETISQLNEGLEKIDALDTYYPGDQWFEQMVLRQQEQLQKKYRRELGWFILSALLILCGVIFTLMEIPQLFLILQAAAAAVTVIYSFKGAKKQVDGR